VAAPRLTGPTAVPFSSILLAALAFGTAGRLAWLALGLGALRTWRRGASPAVLPGAMSEMEGLAGVRARFLVSERMLLSRLALSREQVVDAEVVRLTGSRRDYLEALRAIALQSGRAAVPGLPFFHHRGHLRERVAQLCTEVSMSRSKIIALATACSSVLALTAFLGVTSFPLMSSAEAGGKPMKVTSGVQRPELLNRTTPVYPESAKASKAEGVVIVECVIDEQGKVTQAELKKTSRNQDLDQSALDAVKTWTFKPATLKGKPVAVYYMLTINFALDDKDKKK
jgi:TonB family protein